MAKQAMLKFVTVERDMPLKRAAVPPHVSAGGAPSRWYARRPAQSPPMSRAPDDGDSIERR